ncbi:MAG: T9SS type A sorting domain-containing protein, partial [Bacteroidota bacterium]
CFYFHSQDNCYGGCTDVSSGWYVDDISIVTGAPVFNNPETWENGLGDWQCDKGTWEVGTPTSGPNSAHGGTKCAATVLGGNYDEWVDSRLISPVYTVPPSNQNPRLRFWQWYNISAGDYGLVQIKAVGSSTWVDLSGQYVNTGSGIWTYPSLDLTSYAGQNVQFCFYFHSQDNCYGGCTDVSTGWYIDDISIINDTGPFINTAVTYTVDMSTASGFLAGVDSVYISGNFPGATWNVPGSNPAMKMSRIGSSMIYSVTLQLPSATYEYKYFKNAGWTGEEWGGNPNRSVFVYPPVTLEDTWGGKMTWYNLQTPGTGTINPCEPFNVSALAYIPNNKTGSGGPAFGLQAWIGYSTQNTHPATWSNWVQAPYFGASGTSDEFKANLGPLLPYGTYYYASRFKQGSNNYVYGGYNGGSWNYTTNISGVVTVLPTIIPTITGLGSVCSSTSGISYSTESGKTTYTWSVSSGGVITAGAGTNTITVTWNTSGAQTVSVNYSSTSPCSASVVTVKNVTVNPRPVPTITGTASLCAGTTGMTYFTETGMTGYTWLVSSGGTITAGAGTNAITVTWNTAGAQTVSVSYTNANSCTPLTPTVKNITVNPRPVPVISGSASVCAGTSGVTYSTETGKTGYFWTVSSGGSVTAGSGTSAITVTWNTAGAQTVSVTYTNSNGCTPVTPTVKNISVNPSPVPAITGTTPVCAGTTGITYSTETEMTGYTWSISSGGTITAGSGTNTITVTWNTAGTQTVSVTYTNANGCTPVTPTVKNIAVNARPAPTISGAATACAPATGITYTTETGMTGYLWTVSPGGTITAGSGTNSITVTWNSTGAQSVSVNYTNASGCAASTPTVKAVTVNPRPTPTITGLDAVCAGTAGVTYTTENGMTGYSWIISGGTITAGNGTKTITVTWNTAGAQSVRVNYANASGCLALSYTLKTVTVNPRPAPAITGADSPCAGSAGVTYTTETGMTGYAWTVSSGGTITAGSGTHTLTVTWNTGGAQTVTVNYNNGFGCSASTPAVKNISVIPKPDAAGTVSGPATVFQGQTDVSYSVSPIANATGYNWTLPTGATITSGDNTNTILVAFSQNATSGVIKVNGINTCGTGTGSPDFNVLVNPLINSDLNLTNLIVGSGQNNCYNALQNITVAGNGTLFFILSGGSASFIAGHNIRFLPGTMIMNGGYMHGYITTTGSYCGTSAPSMVMNPLGTEENSNLSTEVSFFKVYPNPTSGNFNIELKNDSESEDILVQIYGMMGETIFKEEGPGFLKKEISLGDRPKGIYVISIMQGNRTGTRKIIRQ